MSLHLGSISVSLLRDFLDVFFVVENDLPLVNVSWNI